MLLGRRVRVLLVDASTLNSADAGQDTPIDRSWVWRELIIFLFGGCWVVSNGSLLLSDARSGKLWV
jgi:hypothetical protein